MRLPRLPDRDTLAGTQQPPVTLPSAFVHCLRTIGGASGIAAGLCYSSFVLAGPLGSRLDPLNSFVSELEVRGQPGSGFFRLSDAMAGFLVLLLAVIVRYTRPAEGRPVGAGCFFLACAGSASILDAANPMPCTPSTDSACRRLQDTPDLFAQLHQNHTVSSVLGVTATLAGMLLLGAGSVAGTGALDRATRLLAVLIATLACAQAWSTFSGGYGVGLLERTQVLLVSTWLVTLGYGLLAAQPRTREAR